MEVSGPLRPLCFRAQGVEVIPSTWVTLSGSWEGGDIRSRERPAERTSYWMLAGHARTKKQEPRAHEFESQSGSRIDVSTSAFPRLIACISADLPPRGIGSEESLRTPTKAWLLMDATGCWWTSYAPIDMRLRYARWTSVDVLGRLWMAPGAGFEVGCKYVMRKDGGSATHADTPSNTPGSQCTLRGSVL